MMFRRTVITLALVALTSNALVTAQSTSEEEGLTPKQMQAVAALLPNTPVYSIRFLRERGRNRRLSATVLMQAERGWQILVVSPHTDTTYEISWKSDILTHSFLVSSPNRLDTQDLKEGGAVTFSGCTTHHCSETFSALLYVPSMHRALTATCHDKKTDYSFPVTLQTTEYKNVLSNVLQGISGHEEACSPDIQSKRMKG